jgi:hypothetical protein
MAKKARTDPQERLRAKHAKWLELVNARTQTAIHRLRLVRNLANRNSYAYSQTEALQVMHALEQEIEALRTAFTPPPQSEMPFSVQAYQAGAEQ